LIIIELGFSSGILAMKPPATDVARATEKPPPPGTYLDRNVPPNPKIDEMTKLMLTAVRRVLSGTG